jgi:P4 family phage/plasmid primase-like protien
MKVIAYLNSIGCKWEPIPLDVEDDKKILKRYTEDGTMPTMNDFENDALIERRKNWKYDTIAIDTRFIQQLDIDSQEAYEKVKPILEEQPYFLSKTKKFPHIFIILGNKQDHGKRSIFTQIDDKIDILNGQWSYCDINTDIINYDKPIQTCIIPRNQILIENNNLTMKYSNETIKTLLEIINESYIDDHYTWVRIAIAIRNCGCEFELFDNWSKKSKKYGGTKKLWKSISKGTYTGVGIGTLCYYAKQSNSYLFNLIRDKLPTKNQVELIDRFMDQSAIPSITNSLVGEIFYEKFQDKYTYSNKTWYRLNDGGIYEALNNDADTILAKEIKKYFQSFILRVIENTDDENKKKKLWKAHTTIEGVNFQKQSVEASKQQFLNEKLNEELDTNDYLIGFTNGVYDLKNNIFRKGTIEDKVSFTTRYAYTEKEDHIFFDNLINSWFETPEMADYFKKHIGSFLEASNKEEKIYFWNGKGRNGKGTIDTLLRETLGSYYTQLDNGYYTIAKKQNSIAEPELIKLEHKRCVMTFEPAEATKYINNKTKKISGNDPIEARDLYGKANEIKVIQSNFKCVIQTNHLPNFDEVDLGLLQRIEVIDFPYSFLEASKMDCNNKNHKVVNSNLKDNLKSKHVQFFNYLLKWYYIYKQQGISNKPKEVVLAVKEYSAKIDTIKTFIENVLIKTDKKEDKISVRDLLEIYNETAIERMMVNTFSSKINNIIPVGKKRIGSSTISGIEGYKLHDDYKTD